MELKGFREWVNRDVTVSSINKKLDEDINASKAVDILENNLLKVESSLKHIAKKYRGEDLAVSASNMNEHLVKMFNILPEMQMEADRI